MMHSTPNLRRWLAGALTLGIVAAVVAVAGRNPEGVVPRAGAETARAESLPGTPGAWALFGGSPGRNMVNTIDKNVATDFVPKAGGKNVLWKSDLGSRAYGGPVIAGGKIFVGTNNEKPRNPRDVDAKKRPADKGIGMCFDQSTSKFLGQAVHDKIQRSQAAAG